MGSSRQKKSPLAASVCGSATRCARSHAARSQRCELTGRRMPLRGANCAAVHRGLWAQVLDLSVLVRSGVLKTEFDASCFLRVTDNWAL
eukprot:SAG11_NODE_1341_length_5152_cov_3.836525_1_plen_89_part_00